MKNMRIPVIGLATVLLGSLVQAQTVPGMLSVETMDAVGTLLQDRAFSANFSTLVNRGGKQVPQDQSFMTAEGKVRTELVIKPPPPPEPGSKLKPPPALQGMDHYVQISRPDQKLAYLILPGLKGYAFLREPPAAAPAPNPAVAPTPQAPVIQRVELGEEAVENRACLKVQVLVTMPDGKRTDGTVWEAQDQPGVPLRVTVKAAGGPVTLTFRNARAGRPDPNLFELPAGLKQYTSLQDMMMTVFQQLVPKDQTAPTPETIAP